MLHSTAFQTHYFQAQGSDRRLAFSSHGDPQAQTVLLCLPGLLETRHTFDPLLHAVDQIRGLRVISMDFCGRGDSDPLPESQTYRMSVYLKDIGELIHQEILAQTPRPQHICLVGTSMGGILALYVAADPTNAIDTVILNDVGFSLSWSSIYGLYGQMSGSKTPSTPAQLAAKLNVSLRALIDVQSPKHFDLQFQTGLMGMKFTHLSARLHCPVHLLYGSESAICTSAQVAEAQVLIPAMQVLKCSGAKHPVPYTAEACDFILKQLPEFVPEPLPEEPEPLAEPLPEPAPEIQPELQPEPPSWWRRIKAALLKSRP